MADLLELADRAEAMKGNPWIDPSARKSIDALADIIAAALPAIDQSKGTDQ